MEGLVRGQSPNASFSRDAGKRCVRTLTPYQAFGCATVSRTRDSTHAAIAACGSSGSPEYTERVKKRIGSYARRPPGGNVVMVTHNVNIAALSRHSVATCEMVLMRPDGCCDARPVERFKA